MNRIVRSSAASLLMMGLVSMSAIVPATAATPVEETQALISRGDLDGALKRIERHLAGSPQDAEGRFTRALILVKQNKGPEAIKAFTELTRDYPQLPEPYNNLAVLYAQAGDYEQARDALEAALATNPSYATAHENLGDIYAALAGAAYNRALALDANNSTTRYKLSLLGGLQAGPAAQAQAQAQAQSQAQAPIPAPAPVPQPAAAAPVLAPAAAVPAAVAAPAVEAAPTPVAAVAAEITPAASNAALTALEAWAKAWSARDVDGYLAAYASDFKPEGGLGNEEWQAQRRVRINRPKQISVSVVAPVVQAIDAEHVRISFTQDYRSDTLDDEAPKQVEMALIGGVWKITREIVR